MGQPVFDVFRGNDDQFYFRLKAGNGEIVLQSEGYTGKAGAINGAESVKENAPKDERYDKRESQDGQFYFVLKAGNHQIIGVSEMYSSPSGRDEGIEAVKRAAAEADIRAEGTYLQIFEGNDDQFYFRVRASNGEIVLQSEGYTSRSGAENGLNSVKENSQNLDRYENRTSENDKPYFVLKAGNGQVIGVSEMYESESARDNGINAVKTAVAAGIENGE